jgi:hypothetical protein
MRNEHIVRARQTPEAAINPYTGLPWRVIHVDNSATGTGTGTGVAASPYTTLGAAQVAAVNPYDIVFVHQGISTSSPYVTPAAGYSFNTPNQYLVGEGSGLTIPTVDCGNASFFNSLGSTAYPVITNPVGTAVVVNQPGTVVDHLQIVGSRIGISDGAGFASGVATISDVVIVGNGPGQRGVEIANSTGTFNFDRLQLIDLTNDGLVVSAVGGDVNVTNSQLTGNTGTGILASGSGATVDIATTTIKGNLGTAVDASGARSRITLVSSTIAGTRGDAIVASGSAASIAASSVAILATEGSALIASGQNSRIDGEKLRIQTTGSDAVVVSGSGATIVLDQSIVGSGTGLIDGFGALVTGSNSGLYLTGSTRISNAASDGIHVVGDRSTVLVRDSSILNSGGNGLYIDNRLNSGESQISLLRSRVDGAGANGIFVEGVSGTAGVLQIFSSTIANAQTAGVAVNESNVDIGRDPAVVGSRDSAITNTGGWGVVSFFYSKVRVQNTTISGVVTGIEVQGNPGPTALPNTSDANNLTAISNSITFSGSTGILIEANHVAQPAIPTTYANALLLQNRIISSGSATGVTGISLVTTNPTSPATILPAIVISDAISTENLSALNLGTTVTETPPFPPSVVGWDFGPATPWATRIPPELPPTPAVPTPP